MAYNAKTSAMNTKSVFPEVHLSFGPYAVADIGNGSATALYGHHWAVVLTANNQLKLLRERDNSSGWDEITLPSSLPTLSPQARKVQLAFDQSAQPTLAWEINGAIYVLQWQQSSQTWVTQGPFSGRDPVLISDILVTGHVPSSDIILFHAGLDRQALYSRLQRDFYSTAYLEKSFTLAHYLNQATAHPYLLQLALVDDNGEKHYLKFTPYPILLSTLGVSNATYIDGQYLEIILSRSLPKADIGTAMTTYIDGQYFSSVLARSLASLASSQSTYIDGELINLADNFMVSESGYGLTTFINGAYVLVIVLANSAHTAVASTTFINGAYVTV